MFKRIIQLIICTLSATYTLAQEKLAFSPDEWDFGTILETDGPVSHTFTGENRGDKPLVILDVVASCGCTKPEFSRQPILPGGKAVIKVTYDPTNRPGSFNKDLAVYSSDRRKIASLTIRGEVTPRPKALAELYPIDAGEGLLLNSTTCAFSYVYPGREVFASIGYANSGDRPLQLNLAARTESGLLTLDYPRSVPPGDRGEIRLSYLVPAGAPRYGTIRDLLAVQVNGRDTGTSILVHAFGADNPADTPKNQAPAAHISENILKFGVVKRNAPVRTGAFSITNEGKGTLIVRAVEPGEHTTTDLQPDLRIPAGATRHFEIRLDPRKQEPGIMTDLLTFITNDPGRPMRKLRITAIIEE